MDDVAKRDLYRKAHGLNTEGFGGWTARQNQDLEQSIVNPGELGQGQVDTASGAVANDEDGGLREHLQQEHKPKKPLKKWLGIW